MIAGASERLPPFRVPKAVVVLDEFPRTSTGKMGKDVLRKRYADHYATPVERADDRG